MSVAPSRWADISRAAVHPSCSGAADAPGPSCIHPATAFALRLGKPLLRPSGRAIILSWPPLLITRSHVQIAAG